MLKINTVLFLIALSILAGIHMIALELFLYWRYLWLDVPVHVLGGVVVVLGAYTFNELKLPLAHHLVASFWHTLIFVVSVMIAWEVFEVWTTMCLIQHSIYLLALREDL